MKGQAASVIVGRTREQLAERLKAKRLIGDLILAAKAACPYVPDHVAGPNGGTLPVGRNLTRAVENVQAFLAETGEEY
jgi:hypothetical protein